MKQDSAAAAYKSARFESAPPLKLVQLMYEGALRFLEQAEAAMAASEVGRFQERCLRAQSVIAELRVSLDPEQAPELAEQLHGLYLFAEAEICAALAAESSAGLAHVRGVLTTLLDGWKCLEVAP
ncbi:MAG: flagellar export chaperone FliS [Planctomycetes bacterium]|nr:flagellar export chaperone FliS [Planctomycetota bacterium]